MVIFLNVVPSPSQTDDQRPGQAVADAEQLLQHLGCLQGPGHAAQRAQDAGLGASGDLAFRRRFREQAAVTGPVAAVGVFLERLEGINLGVEAQDSGGNQGFSGEVTRIVDQEPGCEVVGPVGDDVVIGNQVEGVVRAEALLQGDDGDLRVDAGEGLLRAFHLRRADGVGGMNDLALQV